MKGNIVDIVAGLNDALYLEIATAYGDTVIVKHDGLTSVGFRHEYVYNPSDVIAQGANNGLVIASCKRQIEQQRNIKFTQP